MTKWRLCVKGNAVGEHIRKPIFRGFRSSNGNTGESQGRWFSTKNGSFLSAVWMIDPVSGDGIGTWTAKVRTIRWTGSSTSRREWVLVRAWRRFAFMQLLVLLTSDASCISCSEVSKDGSCRHCDSSSHTPNCKQWSDAFHSRSAWLEALYSYYVWALQACNVTAYVVCICMQTDELLPPHSHAVHGWDRKARAHRLLLSGITRRTNPRDNIHSHTKAKAYYQRYLFRWRSLRIWPCCNTWIRRRCGGGFVSTANYTYIRSTSTRDF